MPNQEDSDLKTPMGDSESQDDEVATPLLSLPDDCLLRIMELSSEAADIIRLRLVCQRLHILSKSQVVWRSHLEHVAPALHLPRFTESELEAPSPDLERLATIRYRLKRNLQLGRLESHTISSTFWVSSGEKPEEPVVDSNVTYIESPVAEIIRTVTWVPPGFLLVSYSGGPTAGLRLYDTGHGLLALPLTSPVAEETWPSSLGTLSGIIVSREEVEEHTKLILACDWTHSSWRLLRLKIPPLDEGRPIMKHIRTITSTYATMRSTAADLRGDFIAFLSDLQGTRGSMLIWDWNTSTCLRFFLKSKVDLSHDSLASSDGDAPLVVAPPYIIYIRTYPLTLHILSIPTDLLEPLDSYDLMQRPHLTLPTWSINLPWEVIDTPSDIRCTLLEHDGENRVVVQIDMCRSRRASSCKLVLAKGVSTQCIGNEDVRFDFDAHLEDVADHPMPLSIGECGISGTAEWFNTLSPYEVDNLLKKVLRLPEFSSSDSTDGIDRRLYCTERELQWNVAYDPMLGRMAVISTPKQRGVYLVDIQ